MAEKTFFVARWQNWDYGEQVNLDRGQIIQLDDNSQNNEKLLAIRYMVEVKGKDLTVLECGVCGAKFLNESDRSAHGRKRHPHRARRQEMPAAGPIDPMTGQPNMLLDTDGDKEEREMMKSTPLDLTKTAASLKG